jgi:hypothetical protein
MLFLIFSYSLNQSFRSISLQNYLDKSDSYQVIPENDNQRQGRLEGKVLKPTCLRIRQNNIMQI